MPESRSALLNSACGGRVNRWAALQLEGVMSRHDHDVVCTGDPCHRPLDVDAIAASVAILSPATFPAGHWAVLAGAGAYRFPFGGDRYRERRPRPTAFGAHLAVEGQWFILPHTGLTAAVRPTLFPAVAGDRLTLWFFTAGLRYWR